MNCKQFKNLLYEYLDGDLPADKMINAETHLQRCDICQKALHREKKLCKRLFEANKNEKTKFSFWEMIKNILKQNDLMIR